MRNLKKILALVLALVMSLSLMATASAVDFADQNSVSEKFETAVEVLKNLDVFNGYAEDNTFRPGNSITREEVAAIIYRIATGDVNGDSVGIYADYNKFPDVADTRWSAGYINFCANAEYIKGRTDGNFDPTGNVTGYEALAMILRAIGYTANGGFTGAGWDLQTAAVAEDRGITKNILVGTLATAATREMVAEILFQSILVNMVNYDQRTGYYELDQTLGYKTFKLEEIEGVVVANEFANLNTEQVLAEGKTQLQVEGETSTRTLNTTSTLNDIGESRYVYTQNVSKVLALGDTGKNVTKENDGAATDITTSSKFQTAAGMPAASDIEYYVDFDRVGTYTCDQRLEFSVTFTTPAAERSFDGYAGTDISWIAGQDNANLFGGTGSVNDDWTVAATIDGTTQSVTTNSAYYVDGDYVIPAADYPVTYHKIIRADLTISQDDMDVLYGIFGAADNDDNNNFPKDAITGDVFVGTVSTNPTTREEQDLSNKISYNTFVADYINDVSYDTSWGLSYNGEWVKFIDNDGDGRCDYAFKTQSVLDEVMDTYTKDGETVLVYNGFSDADYDVRYLDGAPALGDKVLFSFIDNQILVELANDETVKVSSYSWREDEITTDKGTFGQSGIYDITDLSNQIDTMDENVEYIVYFDHFGYVRAYELATKPQYALITEIYGNNTSNGNLVNTNTMTIELSIPNSDTSVEKKEYVWNNPNSDLRALRPWTTVRSTVGDYEYYNYLQPATSHLGVTLSGFGPDRFVPSFATSNGSYVNWRFWSQALQNVKVINALGVENGVTSGEFDYGPYQYGVTTAESTPVTTSFTNIGIASVEDGRATVTGAAQLKLNKDGSPAWYDLDDDGEKDPNEAYRYAVDYIQLSTNDIVANSVRYAINSNTITNYVSNNNNYVNAVDTTEYYIVYNGGVTYFKGFSNFPGLTNEDNNIHAAYAVARDTSADNAGYPYWVADVIVYEVETLDNLALDSVALAYYTPSRTSGSVQQINTINSEYGLTQLVPHNYNYGWNATSGQWGRDYEGYGFYKLYNDTEPVDNVMSAASISRIRNSKATDGNYGANNIHAGIVTRVTEIATGGAYIDVATNYEAPYETTVSLAATDQIYSITTGQALSDDWYGYNEANLLRYSNIGSSQVKVGDLVIWVGEYKTGSNTVRSSANFVVDLGNTDSNLALFNATPTFLVSGVRGAVASYSDPATGTTYGEWQNIMDEQAAPTPSDTVRVTVKYEANNTADQAAFAAEGKKDYTFTTLKNAAVTYVAAETPFKIDGWTVANMSAVYDVTGAPVGGTWDGSTFAVNAVDVTNNFTITVKYNRAVTSFQATGGSNPNANTFQYKLGNDSSFATDATSAVTTLQNGTAIPYGAEFTLRIPAADVNSTYTYTASVSNGTFTGTNATANVSPEEDDSGNLVWTGTITGATTVTVTETKGAVVKISLIADTTNACDVTGIADGDEVPVGSEIKFQVAEKSGYALDKVTYRVIGGDNTVVTLTPEANGDYVIPGTATTVGNSNVEITVVCYSTTSADFTIAADTTNAPTAPVDYVINGIDGKPIVDGAGSIATDNSTGKTISVQAGCTITLTSSAEFYVKSNSASTNPDVTSPEAATDPDASGTYSITLTVTNATAETITLGNSSMT